MAKLKELNSGNFKDFIKDGVKVVMFWAEWCGPCRTLRKVVEDMQSEKDTFGILDTDAEPSITGEYGVISIPTLVFIKNGRLVDRLIGAVPEKKITEKLEWLGGR